MDVDNYLKDNPLWIADIGASGGINKRWSRITDYYKAILFEPDPREYKQLKDIKNNNLIVLNSALSDSTSEMHLNLCKRQEVSSFYTPNFNFIKNYPDHQRFEIVEQILLPVDTLNNQLRKNSIEEIDFIKIDVQGHELPILKGSDEYLKNVIGMEVEVEFVEVYENQPLFFEVDYFIREKDFELYDLKRYFWKNKHEIYSKESKGQLIFGDALYFKKPEKLLSIQNIDEKKILRSVFVYLSYGYVGLARELIIKSNEKNIIKDELKDDVLIFLSKQESNCSLPDFKGKDRLGLVFENLANKFRTNHFSTGTDKKIGN